MLLTVGNVSLDKNCSQEIYKIGKRENYTCIILLKSQTLPLIDNIKRQRKKAPAYLEIANCEET